MMKKIFVALIILLFLLLGCVQPQEQPKKIKVAVVIPLTGAVAFTGEDFLNGMLLAKDKINSNVELYIEDSQSNAKDGISAARKILDTEDIDVVVSLQSAVVVPLVGIADEYNKPLIATAISQNEFTQKSKNAFRIFPSAGQEAALQADFANKKGFKRVSLLTISDEYGASMKEQFKKSFKGEIIHEETFAAGDTDFRTILQKLSDSEVIYFAGYIPHYVALFRQREELGKDITILSNLITVSAAVKSQVGDLLDNTYATIPESMLANEKTKEFVEEYTKKYGKNPDWGAPFGYDIMLVLDAIQKNSKKPTEALHEISVEGLNGTISFDENREAYVQLTIVQARKGIIEKAS